jgi:hypothetical protein
MVKEEKKDVERWIGVIPRAKLILPSSAKRLVSCPPHQCFSKILTGNIHCFASPGVNISTADILLLLRLTLPLQHALLSQLGLPQSIALYSALHLSFSTL